MISLNSRLESALNRLGKCDAEKPFIYGGNFWELNDGVYHFYIDESGQSLSGDININDENEYYIGVGIFMVPQKIDEIMKKCEEIKQKYNFGLELKYSNILPKGNSKDDSQPELMKDLLYYIVELGSPFMLGISDKKLHREYYNTPYTDRITVIEFMLYQLATYLSMTNGDAVAYVYDDACNETEQIKNNLECHRKDGFRGYWGPRTKDKYQYLLDYRPVDSKDHVGIQLADICCGAVRESIKFNNDEYFNIIRRNMLWGPFLHPVTLRNSETGKKLRNKYGFRSEYLKDVRQ